MLEQLYFVKFLLNSVTKKDQLLSLKEMFFSKYGINMPDSFYQAVLQKIKDKDKKFMKALRSNNIYNIISVLKNNQDFNSMLEDNISPQTYFLIPSRYIKSIEEKLEHLKREQKINELNILFKEEAIWKVSRHAKFTEEETNFLAYQMFLSIGLDNSLQLLSNMYGKISYETVYYLFSNLELNNVEVEEGIPNLNTIFLDFLFSNKKDMNNNMRLILNGNAKVLFLNFSYFYQNISYFISKLGWNMPLKKVESLLSERYVSTIPYYPEISADIIDDMESSFHYKYDFKDYSQSEIEKQNVAFYEENIKNQIVSSIPQISFIQDDMICEVLAKNDPKILVMGYRTNNCYRFNGEASILFRKSIKSKHMRLVSVSTPEKKDIAMMLLARNGNVLVGQGIEISKSYQTKEYREKIYYALKNTMKKIMDEMNKEEDDIVATIIGNSNANVSVFNSNCLSFRVTPILEVNPFQEFYNGFNHYQYLLDLKQGCTLKDIKLYTPTKEYYDKRDEVLYWVKKEEHFLEIEKRLFSIDAIANTGIKRIQKQLNNKRIAVYCNTDWYIILFEDGEIESTCLDIDPRAKEEYNAYLEMVKRAIGKTKNTRKKRR